MSNGAYAQNIYLLSLIEQIHVNIGSYKIDYNKKIYYTICVMMYLIIKKEETRKSIVWVIP